MDSSAIHAFRVPNDVGHSTGSPTRRALPAASACGRNCPRAPHQPARATQHSSTVSARTVFPCPGPERYGIPGAELADGYEDTGRTGATADFGGVCGDGAKCESQRVRRGRPSQERLARWASEPKSRRGRDYATPYTAGLNWRNGVRKTHLHPAIQLEVVRRSRGTDTDRFCK